MKLFSFLSLFLLAFVVHAGIGKSRLAQVNYVVISDEYNVDVPAGQCIVKGLVANQYVYTDQKPAPIVGGRISTLDGENKATTDSTGTYHLLLESQDTSIYFFMPGYEEIVIWTYKFRSQHVVTINFYPGWDEMQINVDKPVIYLYADEEVDAEIQFSCKGRLSFTYPQYNEKWKVSVTSRGLVEKSTGKVYPYLFWEATTDGLNYQGSSAFEGFMINTDSTVSFLENSLTALGLSETEQADFITFWGPKMIVSPYAFVQFRIDEDYEKEISQMTITPTPDAMRRVFMLFTPFQAVPADLMVLPQVLPAFDRKGFTVIEWGGSEIPVSVLNY